MKGSIGRKEDRQKERKKERGYISSDNNIAHTPVVVQVVASR